MRPAFSVISFTTLAGAAQGLVSSLSIAVLTGHAPSTAFLGMALGIAVLVLVSALVASFFHLGQPQRAWRAVLMWRTSWLSREVIVLPAFIGIVALWWLALRAESSSVVLQLLPLAAILLAGLLWYCTSMIYACLRFIQEWAHPLTLINFTLTGMSSGLVLACALAALAGEANSLRILGPAALIVTLAAWTARTLSLRRNAALRPRSTLQSAIGVNTPRLAQKSMGMSAGAYNTREYFHGATLTMLRHVRLVLHVMAFGLPAALLAFGLATGSTLPWLLAPLVQGPGLLAERWFFFAQTQHPQNLYYQVVS